MKISEIQKQLLQGDHLLYESADWIDRIINLKTCGPVAHIEISDGPVTSTASRNGIGVNRYPFRGDGLWAVLRPNVLINYPEANHWFESKARGQKYDFLGLCCFTLAVMQGSTDRMFCSEYSANWDRMAGIPSFPHSWPADMVSPSDNLKSPAFGTLWLSAKAQVWYAKRNPQS